MFLQLLGVAPAPEYFKKCLVRLKWLSQTFGAIPEDADEITVQRHARAFILRLIGGVIAPDHSGSLFRPMYLPLVADLDACGEFSWGSACLASLYRALCRGARPTYSELIGPLTLLQVCNPFVFLMFLLPFDDHIIPYCY